MAALALERAPYTLWPKQTEALWMLGFLPGHPPPGGIPVNELLYGGAGGGGKSYLIRALMVLLSEIWPGSRLAIFRKKMPELQQNHIDPLRKEVPPDFGTYNSTKAMFYRPNGSVIEFHHCENDDDYLDYKGFEWDAIAFEEATELSHPALAFIASRCRSTNPGWRKTVLMASNPGGRAHLYVKSGWVDGATWGTPFWGPPDKDTGLRFRRCFLPSRLKDNPSLPYEETLAGMNAIPDPWLRAAIAEGRWDLPAGQFFTRFSYDLHVVPEFEIPPEWPRWRGLDYGLSDPACCLWFARDPTVPYPRVYVYREWFQRGIIAQRQAQLITNLSYGDPPIPLTFADPSIWKRTGHAVGATYGDEYAAGGLTITKADNSHERGWARIKRALDWSQENGIPPELQIFETCRETIKELANVEYNPKDPEDIKEPQNDTDLRDDALAALRYGLVGARAATRKPAVVTRYRMGGRV